MANAKRDGNFIPTLIGVSSADGVTPTLVYVDPVTHRVLTSPASSSGTPVDNEIVTGSGTTFTLANIPISGSQHVYGAGIRLTPGVGNDYTISGAVITMANSYAAGSVLADYRM